MNNEHEFFKESAVQITKSFLSDLEELSRHGGKHYSAILLIAY